MSKRAGPRASKTRSGQGRGLIVVTCFAFVLALSTLGCATTRAVRPLGRGKTELSMGLGGPLSGSYRTANPPPIPVATLGARHGVRDAIDVYLDLQPGAFVFGITWVDAGAALAFLPCAERRFCLLASGTSHVLSNFRDTMLLEQLTLVASLRLGRFTPYLGWDSVFQLMPTLDHMPIPFVGARIEHGRWFAQAEARWYAPFSDGHRSAAHYLSPGGAGALGISLTLGGRL